MMTDAEAPHPPTLSQHAEKNIAERQIEMAWIARTLDAPERVEPDRLDPTLLHALGRVPEWDGHVPRLVYNHAVAFWCVATDLFRPYAEAKAMTVNCDPEAEALYLRLDDSPIIESEEVSPGVVLDFNEEQQVVGVEILNIKDRVPPTNLKQIQFEVA
jgi:uncharacterized protein YuzE